MRLPTPSRPGYSWWPAPWQKVKADDRLWVRENFRVQQVNRSHEWEDGKPARILRACIDYEADDHRDWIRMVESDAPLILSRRGEGESGKQTALHPCIHMPQQTSRLTLLVTDVKIEHLQSITYIEAKAEGVDYLPGADDPRESFGRLWDSLHGAGAWRSNPEVVALTFTVHQANIDQMKAAA